MHGSSISARSTGAVILNDTHTRTSNLPRTTPFNRFAEEEEKVDPPLSPVSLLRKEMPTSTKGGSSSWTIRTPGSRARVTIAKTKELTKTVRRVTKTKRILRTVDGAGIFIVAFLALRIHSYLLGLVRMMRRLALSLRMKSGRRHLGSLYVTQKFSH